MRLRAAMVVLLWACSAFAGPLATPHITQETPKGRGRSWVGDQRCGPTAMAMVARSHGRAQGMSNAKLIDALDRQDGRVNEQTSFLGMVRMASRVKLQSSVVQGWSKKRDTWVRRRLALHEDVIVLGNPTALPYSRQSFDRDAGHYVLVSGLDAHGKFVVHDPLRTGQYALSSEQLGAFVDSFLQVPQRGSMLALRDPTLTL